MKFVMVRYQVRPDRAEENETLIRAVFEELDRSRPTGLRYAAFVLEDGVSFVHVASTEDGRNPLLDTEAFGRFQANICDRCEVPPAATPLRAVGSYGVRGD
jgi:hypothetical protein